MKTVLTIAAATVTALLAAPPALAQHNHNHAAPASAQSKTQSAAPSAAQAADLADGEIRRIDTAKGTVLLKHGELKALNMGPMTMGFRLKDPAMAQGLKAGDKVRFAAEQKGEELIVTRIQKVQ